MTGGSGTSCWAGSVGASSAAAGGRTKLLIFKPKIAASLSESFGKTLDRGTFLPFISTVTASNDDLDVPPSNSASSCSSVRPNSSIVLCAPPDLLDCSKAFSSALRCLALGVSPETALGTWNAVSIGASTDRDSAAPEMSPERTSPTIPKSTSSPPMPGILLYSEAAVPCIMSARRSSENSLMMPLIPI